MLLHRTRKSLIFSPASPLKEARRLRKQSNKLSAELMVSPGKILAGKTSPLRLKLEHLSRHMFIGGGSGGGKSKLIELLIRQITSQGGGLTLIDPHGDTAVVVLRYLIAAGVDPAAILYLEPGMESCFSFDPFEGAPVGVSPEEKEHWLSMTVDRIVGALLRNVSAADQEVMNRLKRWLKNILTACGVSVDERNTHAGLDEALVFTDPDHRDFPDLYAMVKDHLPADIAADFQKLIGTQRAIDREKWVESTINRLRDLLSPIVRLMFGQHARSISLRDVLQQRKIVLLNLAEGKISRSQGNVIGGLFINLVIGTARGIPAAERTEHFLIIDEAENYIGEDLRMAFAELRKFKLVVVIIFQDLTCLRKGELDLVGKVVSQCGLQITFQQGNPEDVEFLAKAYGYGALDFTPLLTDVVTPDGYEWVQTKSIGFTAGASVSESHSRSVSETESHTEQTSTAESIQRQVSIALSESHGETDGWGESHTESIGESRGISKGRTEGESITQSEGTTTGTTKGYTYGTSESVAKGKAEGETWSTSEGESEQTSEGTSEGSSSQFTASASVGQSSQDSEGRSFSAGKTGGKSVSSSDTVVRSAGESEGRNSTSSTSSGRSSTETSGISEGNTHSVTESKSTGKTKTESEGGSVTRSKTFSESESEAWNKGSSHGTTETTSTGTSRGTSETVSAGVNVGSAVAHSRSGGTSVTNAISTGVSRGEGETKGTSVGTSKGNSTGATDGTTTGKTDGVTVTFGKTPLARQKIDRDKPTGKLVVSMQDQLGKYIQILASLPDRTILVKCKNMGIPFLLGVHDVSAPGLADVPAFLRRMRSAHECFFDPREVRARKPQGPAPRAFDADEENPIA